MTQLKPAGEIIAFAYLAKNGERKLVAFELDPLAPEYEEHTKGVLRVFEKVANVADHISPLVSYQPEPVPLAFATEKESPHE